MKFTGRSKLATGRKIAVPLLPRQQKSITVAHHKPEIMHKVTKGFSVNITAHTKPLKTIAVLQDTKDNRTEHFVVDGRQDKGTPAVMREDIERTKLRTGSNQTVVSGGLNSRTGVGLPEQDKIMTLWRTSWGPLLIQATN